MLQGQRQSCSRLTKRHRRIASKPFHLTPPKPGSGKHHQGQNNGYQRFSNMPATCIVQEMLDVHPSPASEHQRDLPKNRLDRFNLSRQFTCFIPLFHAQL